MPWFYSDRRIYFCFRFFEDEGEEAIKKIEKLEERFSKNKKLIEQWVNSWSIGDLFINCTDESYQNDSLIMQFCDVLVYNWQQRLKELFPHKKIIVETGYEIMGELGVTITVYEE